MFVLLLILYMSHYNGIDKSTHPSVVAHRMYPNACLSPLAVQQTHSTASLSLFPSDSSHHPPEVTRVLVPHTHIKTERKQPKGIVCRTCLTCMHTCMGKGKGMWREGEGGGGRGRWEGRGREGGGGKGERRRGGNEEGGVRMCLLLLFVYDYLHLLVYIFTFPNYTSIH